MNTIFCRDVYPHTKFKDLPLGSCFIKLDNLSDVNPMVYQRCWAMSDADDDKAVLLSNGSIHIFFRSEPVIECVPTEVTCTGEVIFKVKEISLSIC